MPSPANAIAGNPITTAKVLSSTIVVVFCKGTILRKSILPKCAKHGIYSFEGFWMLQNVYTRFFIN